MDNVYNDMFAVSNIKGTYDLVDKSVYDKITGELVNEGTQIQYNTEFLLRLNRLYILDVKPFLNHQLTNSNNKSAFFDYVKYAALNSEIIKHQGQKQAIKDWVNDNEQLFKVNPISKSEKHLKELHTHIFKGNAFEIWQTMFDSFQITESSRTNVKFMFEEMKKDNLIHNTVNQKTFLNWISETYQITVEKTSNYSKTIERKSIYSNAKQRCKVQGT